MDILSQIIAILIIALAGALVAKKLKQSLITGYLIASVLASVIFGKVMGQGVSEIVSEVGLTLLLFTIGLEFSFRRLSRVRNIAVAGALSQILITTGLFFLFFAYVLNLSYMASLIFSYAFSLASTAVVAKTISQKGEMDTLFGEIAVGWLMIQDLAVIPLLVLISQVNLNGPVNQIFMGITFSIVKAGILLYLTVFLGKKILPKILIRVSRENNREIFLLAIVILIFTSAYLAGLFGLSASIGAFLAGLIIAESAHNHTVFSEIRPLRDIFAIIFFVSVGLSTQWSALIDPITLFKVFTVVTFIFLIKTVVGILITLRFKYHIKTAFQVGFSLSGVGEFSLVIGLAAARINLISQADYSFLAGVTILSLITTPILTGIGEPLFHMIKNTSQKWSPQIYKLLFSDIDRYRKEHDEVILENHVVICGHGRVGRQIARCLALAGIPYVVVDYNQHVISELSSTGVETVLGDPADYEVLRFAKVEKALVVIVAVPDDHSQELIISLSQNLHPGIPIVCRSHFDEDRNRLYALGANYVIQPEMEAGLTMSHKILDILGFEKQTINGYVRQVRREQER